MNLRKNITLSKYLPEVLPSLLKNRTTAVYLSVVAFILLSGAVVPTVFMPSNVIGVLRQAGILGVVALGQFVVIMGGAWRRDVGIDLSVGSTLFMITIAFGHIVKWVHSDILTILICLLIGAAVGLINGLIITKGNVSPFIATLAVSLAEQGITWTLSITPVEIPEYLLYLGSGRIGLLPIAFLFFLVLFAIFWVIMKYTTYGIRIYAKSSNPQGARLLGVNLALYTASTYVISGVMAALGGLLYLGFLVHPAMRFIDIFTFDSIAAVLLGGTEFVGGIGSVLGVLPGVVFMRFIYYFVLFFRVPEATRRIMQGLIIFAVAAVFVLQSRRMRAS